MSMNSASGKKLTGIDHIYQSIRNILTTRLGSRLMMPSYGSKLPDLIDAPMNALTISRINAAVAGALHIWEKRYKVTRVKVVAMTPGKIEIDLEGQTLVDGKAVTLEGLVL